MIHIEHSPATSVRSERLPIVNGVDRDWLVRQHAFRFLENLSAEHGDVLPWEPLRDGLEVDGERVTLIGAARVCTPRCGRWCWSMTILGP